MPKRARSHILEEESVRRFREMLPPSWVYRAKSPDYGIDGEVEIFEIDGSSTGLSFNVQLRATDDPSRVTQVRLEVDELDYYRSHDTPTAVVRYGSQNGSFFWQWASNIASRTKITEEQQTLTYRFDDNERWSAATSVAIRRTLEVRRRLAQFPPSSAVPVRVDLSAIPAADRYVLDRGIARAIADSGGALVRAATHPVDVEAFVRLEPCFLAVGIDTITGATFDLEEPTLDDYLSSIIYGLVRIFRCQRLVRQAEALSLLLAERGIAHHSEDLALDACLASARNLPALVKIAIVNGFHDQGPMHALIALTIAKAPQEDEQRRSAMDTFFSASITTARQICSSSEAAVHYSIGNFYRNQRDFLRSIRHYNCARRLRPAYMQADYFWAELGGTLFLSGRHELAQRSYREAVSLAPDDSNLAFLFADALLLAGYVREARAMFEMAVQSDIAGKLVREGELKAAICDHLIEVGASDVVPRNKAEADAILRSGGNFEPNDLARLLREVDSFNPLARFNLGIACAQEGDRAEAVYHFLICAFVQPQDISAWANAAICALGLRDEAMLLCIMSAAIHHMGSEAYDHFRADVSAQGMEPEALALFDEMAMQLLEEREDSSDDGFTLRLLDGDGYQSMTIIGLGEA